MRTIPTLLLLALAACTSGADDAPLDTASGGDTGDTVDPLSWPIDADGPFRVAHRELEITYSPVAGETRTIPVAVWYPTDATTGEDVVYASTIPASDDILGDAPPAAAVHAGGHPVAMHTHGDRAHGGMHVNLAKRRVTHGWIVVSPHHVGNLLWADEDNEGDGHWYHRPLDLAEALAAVAAEDDLDADTSKVVVSGHSRGGGTVWTVAGATFDPTAQQAWCTDCSEEQIALFDDLAMPEVVGSAFLASGSRSGLFGEDGHTDAMGPILAITGSEDSGGGNGFWDADPGVAGTWVEIEGGCHDTFALGVCTDVPSDVGYDIVGTYLLALGRRHVLDDDTPRVVALLDGTQTYGEITTATVLTP